MSKISVGVVGAAGRMGQRIVALIPEYPEFELVGAFERVDHPLLGQDSGRVAGAPENQIPLSVALLPEFPNLRQAESTISKKHLDVLIIFAPPDAAMAALALAERQHSAVVLGTTGFSDSQVEKIHTTARKIPFIGAYNMSQGANSLFSVVDYLVRSLGEEYDVEIVEVHHRLKKDAPSGTAKTFAEIIAMRRGYDLSADSTYGRQGLVGERPTKQIGIHSVRGGDTFGDHTIIFSGPGERIEVTHRVSSRDAFARGALRAAEWVIGQPDGLYVMQEVFEDNQKKEE